MNDFVPLLKTALLLVASNTFMTFAWYGHLKYLHNKGLPLVILISWGIAFFEYCFQVLANRTKAAFLNGYQLKILQEVITLIVFVVFAKVVLGESIRWNHLVSFGCFAAVAWFALPTTVRINLYEPFTKRVCLLARLKRTRSSNAFLLQS